MRSVSKAAANVRRWASVRPPLAAWHGLRAGGCKASTTPGKARQLVAGEVAGQSGKAGQRAAPHWPGDWATECNGEPPAAKDAVSGDARLAGTDGKMRQDPAGNGPRPLGGRLLSGPPPGTLSHMQPLEGSLAAPTSVRASGRRQTS